eukprot:tig00001284_g8014.t1
MKPAGKEGPDAPTDRPEPSRSQTQERERLRLAGQGASGIDSSEAGPSVTFKPLLIPDAASDSSALDKTPISSKRSSWSDVAAPSPSSASKRTPSREAQKPIDYDRYNVSLCGCCKSRRACTEGMCFFPRMVRRIKHMRAYSYGTRAEREAAEARDKVQEAAEAVLCHPCVVDCLKAACAPLLKPFKALMGCSAFLDDCIPQCRYCTCPCIYAACEGAALRFYLRKQWRMGKAESPGCTCCGNECLCRDCCEYLCCPCCALTKDYRERKLRSERRPPPEDRPSFDAPDVQVMAP